MSDTTTTLERAREAAGRYAWNEAFDAFAEADAIVPLGADDLDQMADCAWWLGKMRHCIALRERAHSAYLKAENPRRAARVATELAGHHVDLAEPSVASAWIQRATKLLEDQPEGSEHAWLKMTMGMALRSKGDVENSGPLAAEAAEIGARHGDKDVFALSLAMYGSGLVFQNDVERGMAMVEEATVGAVSGELGPIATGWIYCLMITVSSQLADWQRAGQWTEAAKRWCDRQAINGFPGVCRVHRAEIMRLRGSLSEAEEEARTATVELASFNVFFTAQAFRELGEIRLRMGEIDAAEEAFRQANEMGITPQPGLAQAQLERGKPKAAASALKRALADEGLSPLDRAKLLPTQLEVALVLGDLETARADAADLAEIAESYTSPALRAAADAAAAAVGLAEGDFGPAEQAAKRARRIYTEIDFVYEAAKMSVLLGQIYIAEDDADAAQLEIGSGLSAFERIGALPDAIRARKLLASVSEPLAQTHRVAKTFLFSDIVKSTNLLDAIGDDAWADLLTWHDETLRKLFAENGGEEVSHTGDGFFVAFENADQAIATAVAIQRTLVEHRRDHGFSPQVRIGVHATEADETKGNYHGKGVHEAARIGALAQGGDIIVSASTLDCVSGPLRTGEERLAELRGVKEPVRVVSLEWQDA